MNAQENVKTLADAKRRERIYQPGDWVMLKLRPHRQTSANGSQAIMGKLAKRFNGPFQVLEQVRIVAYRLKLSEETCIHPIFLFTDETTQRLLELIKEVQLPTQFVQHQPIIVPLAILDY